MYRRTSVLMTRGMNKRLRIRFFRGCKAASTSSLTESSMELQSSVEFVVCDKPLSEQREINKENSNHSTSSSYLFKELSCMGTIGSECQTSAMLYIMLYCKYVQNLRSLGLLDHYFSHQSEAVDEK